MKLGGLVAGVLLLFGTAANANDWRVAVSDSETVSFVDVTTLVRTGNSVRFWSDTWMKKPIAGMNRYLTLQIANCDDQSYRELTRTYYLNESSVGGGRKKGDLEYANPDTFLALQFDKVCKSELIAFGAGDKRQLVEYWFKTQN